MKKFIFLFFILSLFSPSDGFSYDIKTHKDMTKAAINSSVIPAYLQSYLGITTDSLFKGPAISRIAPRLEIESKYSAIGWMEEGAGNEDEHNADKEGFNDHQRFLGRDNKRF